jgi:hypothetical protein
VAASLIVTVVFATSQLEQSDVVLFKSFSSRLVATVRAVAADENSAGYSALGTFSFRLALYDRLLEELRVGELTTLCFGHGTSSGGDIGVAVYPAAFNVERLDPNRIIHSEWLRVQYEWGLVGLLLWSFVLGAVIWGARRRRMRLRDGPSMALLAYLPGLLLALSLENVIAGAGSAVTVGFGLLLAMCYGFGSASRPARLGLEHTGTGE